MSLEEPKPLFIARWMRDVATPDQQAFIDDAVAAGRLAYWPTTYSGPREPLPPGQPNRAQRRAASRAPASSR